MTNCRTIPITIAKIMGAPEFALGVADARAGRGQHPGYERWSVHGQWGYERGRIWAALAPRNLALKQAGQVSAEAIVWYVRSDRYIL